MRLFGTSSGRWISVKVTEFVTTLGLSPSRSPWVEMDAAKLVTWLETNNLHSEYITSRLNVIPSWTKGPGNLALRLEVIASAGMRILIQNVIPLAHIDWISILLKG